jgi:protein-tyrosine phosphatase
MRHSVPDMLKPEIYWVPAPKRARLAVMPRPRGDEWLADEISGWRRAGLGYVVSLLEAPEVRDLGLAEEAHLCRSAGIEFVSFPVPDRGVPPSIRQTQRLVGRVRAELGHGVGVGIHCRAGIGRSALLAGCVLLRLGVPRDAVFPIIGHARGVPVPDTGLQVEWLATFLRAGRDAL